MEQLWGAIGAVFGSWMNERAIVYRQLNTIPESWGTAVNVQSMVFGNLGEDCGTGVAFTRDPATGENVFYGEYLINAQGEDVVAGIRTPAEDRHARSRRCRRSTSSSSGIRADAREALPRHAGHRVHGRARASSSCSRPAPASGPASPRSAIAVEMERERLITPEEAILRVNPDSLNQLLRPVFDPDAKSAAVEDGLLLAKGLNAGPGAASGPGRLLGAGRLRVGEAGREGPPRPRRDEPRGHQGDERGRGDPHRPRRHDLPRGARRAGRWGRSASSAASRSRSTTPQRCMTVRRATEEPRRQGRRLDLHRRDDGRGPRGADHDEAVRGPPGPPREDPGARGERRLPPLRDAHGLGRQGPPPAASAPTPTSPTRPRTPSRSAPRGSASAAPSTCSSAATGSPRSAR